MTATLESTARVVILIVAWLSTTPTATADPLVRIDALPTYGTNGVMQGTVGGVDFAAHRVATFIQVEGSGWWTKPTDTQRTVPIGPGGSFVVDVTTGGLDNRATIFCAAVVDATIEPPLALGSGRVPADLNAVVMTCRERYGRTIAFAGHTWAVKEAPAPVGPGGNVFSDQPSDVWVDNAGLHLTLHFRDGRWWSTEVILLDRLSYGTYTFQTDGSVSHLDVNATLGMFTWDAYGDDESSGDSHHREIDFEDSRWGVASDPNTQAVVQPWGVPGNRHRFTLPDTSSTKTRAFIWKPESIRFLTLDGVQSPHNYPPASVIDDWLYLHDPASGHSVPKHGRERVRLNLWLNTSSAPADGQSVEVVISAFSFTPLVDVVDLNKDSVGDILLQHTPLGYVGAWLMNPVGLPVGFAPIWWSSTGDWKIVGTTDLNRDGIRDVVLHRPGAGSVFVWVMNEAGQPTSFEYIGGSPPSAGWRAVATADVNGDTVNDVILQDSSSSAVGALIVNCCPAQARFQSIYDRDTGGWQVVGAADLNDDMVPDLLLQHSTLSYVAAWLMDRVGRPSSFVWVWPSATNGWNLVGTTDLNEDGVADILLQHKDATSVAGWIMSHAGQPTRFVWVWSTDTGGWKVNGKAR